MNINKAIAQHELKIFGGTPKVNRFWDNSNEKSVDILQCRDVPQKGIQSCASIGLNKTDIGLVSNDKSLRVEVLGAVDIAVENFGNIIASVAFEVMESRKCFPGYIVENVISQYIPDSEMRHVLLTNPFVWEHAESILIGEFFLAWLMAVPISEEECKYAKSNGVDALESIFEEKEIDIYNIYRKSII